MTLLRMLRAFTRGSQEKNNSPILNFPMSIIIPRSRDKHPENNEHKAPIKPQSWPGHPGGWSWSQHQAQGAGCTCVLCVARGARGGGGGRHLLLLKIVSLGRVSQHPGHI